MPQMYPMNWFFFSLIILIVSSLTNQTVNYSSTKSGAELSKNIFLKNIKWSW